MAFGISSRFVFEESFRSLWNLPFLAGCGVLGLWVHQFRLRLVAKWLVPLIAIPAAIAGWAFPGTQRAPDPATTPVGAAFDKAPAGITDRKVIRLSKDAQVRPDDGRVVSADHGCGAQAFSDSAGPSVFTALTLITFFGFAETRPKKKLLSPFPGAPPCAMPPPAKLKVIFVPKRTADVSPLLPSPPPVTTNTSSFLPSLL